MPFGLPSVRSGPNLAAIKKGNCQLVHRSTFRGLCMHGNLSQSMQLLDKSVKEGWVPNVFTYSFLLEAANKEREVDKAIRLLDEITAEGGKPNLVNYNVLLTRLTGRYQLFG
ncbi:hypothetical protein PVL29_003899 [Vitis rotundifolia]|uniref:Pentatricopeptide repeat-containing protein n=1 Tax=Vitis rotundifolia TaxID=103349 RepID=A0AA39E066_VITRO|nr:hypothetical protein PVL29_003899 [Vitis rotundifolia]